MCSSFAVIFVHCSALLLHSVYFKHLFAIEQYSSTSAEWKHLFHSAAHMDAKKSCRMNLLHVVARAHAYILLQSFQQYMNMEDGNVLFRAKLLFSNKFGHAPTF